MMKNAQGRLRWFERMGWSFPTLERDERKALIERIEAGALGGIDFHVMMILASGLASLGLLEDSTAVVIGAMLVAPLMGPLIGAGLALTQGNFVLFRKSIIVALLGLLTGLAVSLAMGMLNPGFEPSLEIEARGNPDILDLGIAILSGFVAAYAFGRPGVANTLAGVAIAAALVPPLCVVGIGLTNGRPLVAANSAILLSTNLVAIILSAAFAFAMLGIRGERAKSQVPRWVKRSFLLLVMAALILLLPLLLNVEKRKRLGQSRPLTYPVAAHLQEAVEAYVESVAGVTLITIARVGAEPDSDVGILLATSRPLPGGVKDNLTRLVREVRGGRPAVRVVALQEAQEAQAPVPGP
ncbi:DUF389 domain-containing protein [Candidatus Moduliflexota bacterium]